MHDAELISLLMKLATMSPDVARRARDRLEKLIAKRAAKAAARQENQRNQRKNRNAKKRGK